MRLVVTVARVLFGLVFLVFGLNFFFQFLPMPPMTGPAAAFMGALFATGYMFPLIKVTEILAGVLLISGRFVPLGLLLLAPILVNIAAFHIFLTPGEVGMSAVLVAIEAFLAWSYRDSFRGVLNPSAAPGTSDRH